MKRLLFVVLVLFAFGLQNVNAQDAPLKIESGHPDLKIKVKRCVASGDQVFIDLTFTDVAEDVDISILNGWTEIQDSEGNVYCGYPKLYTKTRNGEYTTVSADFSLLESTPQNISFKLVKVPSIVEYIARMKIGVGSKKYGSMHYAIIKNIPVVRN